MSWVLAAGGGVPGSMPALEYEIGLTLVRLGRAGEALTSLSRTSSAARERSDATLIRAASVTRILALCDTGQLPEAHQLLNETDPAWRVYHTYAAKLALEQQRFPDAEQSASAALRLSRLQAIDTEGSLSVAEDLLVHAQALAGINETGRARDDAKRAMAHVSAIAGEKHPVYERARALAF